MHICVGLRTTRYLPLASRVVRVVSDISNPLNLSQSQLHSRGQLIIVASSHRRRNLLNLQVEFAGCSLRPQTLQSSTRKIANRNYSGHPQRPALSRTKGFHAQTSTGSGRELAHKQSPRRCWDITPHQSTSKHPKYSGEAGHHSRAVHAILHACFRNLHQKQLPTAPPKLLLQKQLNLTRLIKPTAVAPIDRPR